jgi:glutamine amidotransferase
MCRLFGFRAAVVSHAHRSLIAAHNALADQAREHPHGWGIGYFHSGEAYLVKSEGAAAESASFRRAADRLSSNALIAHVRRATVGEVGPLNTHPFRNGRWLFAHNGTIHGFADIVPHLAESTPAALWSRRLGETDSEAFFCFLLGARAREGVDTEGTHAPEVARIAGATASALGRLRTFAAEQGAAAPIVNFILTNGRTFVANRHGRELFFATQKSACSDAERCPALTKPCLLPRRPDPHVNHLLVASEPIGHEDRWEPVPEGSLVGLDERFHLHQYATA